MKIETDGGVVVNTWPDDDERGDWYPDDTVIAQESETGRGRVIDPMRISQTQPDDWPTRAGRRWDGRQWAIALDHNARKQAALERAAKRKEARKRNSTDLDIYERVAALEKRVTQLEQRPTGLNRG